MGQGWQLVWPVESWYEPARHAGQAGAPEDETALPIPHASPAQIQQVVVNFEQDRQASAHEVTPATPWKRPGAQLVGLVWRVWAAKVPGGVSKHADRPVTFE